MTHGGGEGVTTWLRLPGMLCTAAVFTVMDDLVEQPVPAVDLGLEGRTVEGAVDRLLDAVRRVPGPVGLIGQSLGAIVAMAALVREPDAFAGAMLMSTNPRAPRADQRHAWDDSAARVRAGGFDAVVTEIVATMFAHPDPPPPLLDLARRMAYEVGPERFLQQLDLQASRTDLRPLLSRVQCPVLVVAGGRDRLCDMRAHEEIAAATPVARLAVIEHAGHLFTLEDPQAAVRVLGLPRRERTPA